MGNVPAKLEQEDFSPLNRTGDGQKQYRSLSYSNGGALGSVANDSTRSRRATSLVGNLLSSGRMSRADAYNGSQYRKRSSKDREWTKEAQMRHLIVRYDKMVDGGYLAPYGCYKIEKLDYDSEVVQNLIIARKLAPFYTPLQDFDPKWSREEIIKVVGGLSLHAAYEEDDYELEGLAVGDLSLDDIEPLVDKTLSRREQRRQRAHILKAKLYRKRIILQEKENQHFLELKVNAVQTGVVNKWLPSDDLKIDMYSKGSECPICFLYFPDPMNVSRCCLQPICTECFVQIKRKPPHFPHDDIVPAQAQSSERHEDPNMLISEPANCPYCATPWFGVTYQPPENRKVGILGSAPNNYPSPEEAAGKPADLPQQERKLSKDHEQPSVVTSDMIRPDWEAELLKERVKLARRAANATAIHVSNRLVDPGHQSGYTHSVSGTSTFASNNSIVDELEEEMIRHAMRVSLLEQQQDEQRKKSSPRAR